MATHFYRIGKPGVAWGDEEFAAWSADVGVVKRAYAEEVLAKLEPLKERFDVVQYGALSQDEARYPLFCIKTRGWDAAKPSVSNCALPSCTVAKSRSSFFPWTTVACSKPHQMRVKTIAFLSSTTTTP